MGGPGELSWDFSCPDWHERLGAGRTLIPDLPLDRSEAERAVKIFNMLRLPDVPDRPALREAAGEWQRDIVRAVFGSLDEAGLRKVPELFALVPKKNSKTTTGAGIMITALLMNRRPRAEFILVGPTHEVADIAYSQAAGMIEADPTGYLQKRFHLQEHVKTIFDRRSKSHLKIKTFDLKVMTGSKPAGVLIDELHLMSMMSYASRVIGQIRGGTIANPEAFLIFITTQSDQPPAGVFKAELQYARAVRDGKVQEARMLPVLYEFSQSEQYDPAKPWQNPANWAKVLPNLGRSISLDRLISDYATAKEKGEEEERRWASQHLNIEIGIAMNADSWIGAKYWQDAADPSLTLEALIERSDVAVIGIDGGGLDDLMGLSVIGRERTSRDWLVWTHAWAQTDVLMRRPEIAETLWDFERAGDLTICATPTQDIAEIVAIAVKLRDARLLPKKHAIGLDPMGVSAVVDALADAGLENDQIVGVPQGFRLSSAVWGVERKLVDGTFWHSGSTMMDWCCGNARVEQRGNAVLITKQAAGKAKIDPLMAVFDAVMLMSRNPEPDRQPTYQMMVLGGRESAGRFMPGVPSGPMVRAR